MNDDQIVSVAQLREFVKLTNQANFSSNDKMETYEWIGRTLGRFQYKKEAKKNKGVIKEYVIRMTGYSEGMIDKLIRRNKKTSSLVFAETNATDVPSLVHTGRHRPTRRSDERLSRTERTSAQESLSGYVPHLRRLSL
ncbi:MAG: hypothetical protein HZA95_03850 [Candidatus Vogelbacteria bacterium]|nr:hypothetical protein [Candidatus Vogelbacteria bacterium]